MQNTEIAEEVYRTMLGQQQPACALDWVENIFTPGMPYYDACGAMLDARRRLCQRLGTGPEDRDVEAIIDALLANEHTVALKMFQYGALWAEIRGGE